MVLDDNNPTSTSSQQNALEKKLLGLYQELDTLEPEDVVESLRLLRTVHTSYLHSGLGTLSASFASLDASRPWIVYWIVHSLELLGADLSPTGPSAQDVVQFLCQCQAPEGGFGGGPMQLPHLAPTYAAVCALITLGKESALQAVDRPAMHRFLCSLIVPLDQGGGFCIHPGGECDLRACYLALAVADMLCLDIQYLAARSNVVDYICRCQTYEGGLGGEPFNEAHGGYTFCGLAALCLLGQPGALDLPRLLQWATQRQCSIEGGFNGRTNKLVDGCYSFWQGGLFALLQRLPQTALQVPVVPPPPQVPGSPLPYLPIVPPLAFIAPKTPVEQAGTILVQKQATAQTIIGAALQAGDRVDAALQGSTERSVAAMSSEARSLLDQAGTAQAAAETAHFNVSAASCSASTLFPVPDPTDPPPPAVLVQGARTIHLGPPLYNYKALQLWLLRCCQQLRGGMKDKPGKPPDFYHTCYCLSGLSSAQHVSNCILGPRENLLKRADPMVNVVDEKLAAAKKYYAARPVQGPSGGSPVGVRMGGEASRGGAEGQGSGGSIGSKSGMDVDQ